MAWKGFTSGDIVEHVDRETVPTDFPVDGLTAGASTLAVQADEEDPD